MSNDATGLPRQNLGSKFGKSDRTKGLTGRLTRPPVDTEQAAPEPPEPATPTNEPTAPPATKKNRPKPKSKPKAKPEPSAGEKTAPRERAENYPVYLPVAVYEAFKERRVAEGTTNTLLVFDAIDAALDPSANDPIEPLRQMVADSLVGAPKAASSLFERSPQRTRDTIYTGTNTQLVLRVTPSNRAVLEDLITQTGARDRGHLVTVAIVHYLDLQE